MTQFTDSRYVLLAGASALALGLVGPAHAQEDSQNETRRLETVTVGAQKRDQNIQDVPIAVTALSQTQLENAGVADIRALQTVSASFNLNSTQTESGGTTLRIRGVGTTGNNAGLESAVGVFLDGVYLSRPAIALGELFDVEQVEILRGPQGTLFGRNTSAGALTITTRAPQLNEWSGFANATVGAIDGGDFGGLTSAQGGVNIPLVENKLAARIGGAFRIRDGLLTSTTGAEQNTRDRYYLRGQLLFTPTDDLSVRVIVDHQEGKDDCCDAVIVRETPLIPFYAAAGLPANGGVSASGFGALDARTSNGESFKDPGQQTGASAQVDWDLDGTKMTYIGSYRDASAGPNVQNSDFVGLNVFSVGGASAINKPNLNTGKTQFTSHEVRFAGETDRLNWLVGGYYGKESISGITELTLGSQFQGNLNANIYGAFAGLGLTSPALISGFFTNALTPAIGAPAAGAVAAGLAANPAAVFANGQSSTGAFARNLFAQEGESTSVFTHNTFAVTDKLDVTVGARFVDETKDGKFDQLAASNPACVAASANPLTAALGGAGTLARAYLCFPFATPVGLTNGLNEFDGQFKDNELVYTANASYAFTNDVRGYVSFTHGFKSGGFNIDPTAAVDTNPAPATNTPADPRFKSEKVDAWEVGLKADLLDGRVRMNSAIFSSELEDFQVLEFTGVQFQTFNVPRALADGAEVEVFGRLTDNLNASVAVTYSDARYPSDCATPADSLIVRTLCGSKLTNAPEWVGILGLNYDRAIGDAHRFFVSGSVRYEDERRTSTQEFEVATSAAALRTVKVPNDIQEANSKTNLRVGYGSQNERWTVEFWGTNIFNEQTRNVTFNIPLRGFTAQTAARGAFLEEPAMYGLTLRAKY